MIKNERKVPLDHRFAKGVEAPRSEKERVGAVYGFLPSGLPVTPFSQSTHVM